jgi:hypothetical protein
MGADIEYADEVTLASALSGRSETWMRPSTCLFIRQC